MSELTLLDLIEESKAARSSDPRTSHDAVPSISSRNRWQRRIMAAVVGCERMGFRGVTVSDVHWWLSEHRPHYDYVPAENSLARRITDLRRAGCLVDMGITRAGNAGREQVAWFSSASGREALEAS